MPKSQIAAISSYEAGLPATAPANGVLTLKAKQGGKVSVRIENMHDASATVSATVSSDDATYNATTAANNLEAITNVVIPPRTYKDFTVLLRQGIDTWLRFTGSGGTRVNFQVRDNGILDVDDQKNPAPTA